jgi:hypothetical protein
MRGCLSNRMKRSPPQVTGRRNGAFVVSIRRNSPKGRAWISADSYQIVRMETDLVMPVPQIQLSAEHNAIE